MPRFFPAVSREPAAQVPQEADRHAYQQAFEDAINETATEYAPWYVVPADHKWYMRYVVSEIILAALKEMDPRWPEVTKERLEEFQGWADRLHEELGE